MKNDVSTLDQFIESADQRDLTGALHQLLIASSRADHVVVCGDTAATSALIVQLASCYPREEYTIGCISDKGTSVMVGPPFAEAIVLDPDGSITRGFQSVLRYDVDIVATTDIDEESKKSILNAALTGHQVMLGIDAPHITEALAKLVHLVPESPELNAEFKVGIGVEMFLGSAGLPQLSRVLKSVDGVLTPVAWLESDGTVSVNEKLLPTTPTT